MNAGLREDDGRDLGPVPGRLWATTTVGQHPRDRRREGRYALAGVHRGRDGRLMLFGTISAYLRGRIPIFTWLPAYQRTQLRPDLTAGMVLAALAVPQSLGYAAIAGVP